MKPKYSSKVGGLTKSRSSHNIINLRSGRDSTTSTPSSSSRYSATPPSSYTPGSYGSSSTYSSGYGGYGGSSGYESSYSRTPTYGSGLSYGSSYTSPYSSTPSYSSGYGYNSAAVRSASRGIERSASRDFDSSTTSSTTHSSYSRATRDKPSERSYDSLYPRTSRRSSSVELERPPRISAAASRRRLSTVMPPAKPPAGAKPPAKIVYDVPENKGDQFSRAGLRKSSSYAGLHWMHQREAPEPASEKKHSLINVNEIIYKSQVSHRRSGSNSSLSSDGVFDDTKSLSRSREGSQKSANTPSKHTPSKHTPSKPPARDLETILGRDDHMLVRRIIEENKELIEETHPLTSQEEMLIQKIMEASSGGGSLDCLDVLTIIESH